MVEYSSFQLIYEEYSDTYTINGNIYIDYGEEANANIYIPDNAPIGDYSVQVYDFNTNSFIPLEGSGFLVAAVSQPQNNCSELFFSEYVEGSSINKALEIYNPTNNAVDLSNYTIERYANGSNIITDMMTLSGVLQPGDVWIITPSDTNTNGELRAFVQSGVLVCGFHFLP